MLTNTYALHNYRGEFNCDSCYKAAKKLQLFPVNTFAAQEIFLFLILWDKNKHLF